MMSIQSDEFEETLKSDEMHCTRDNNNGCSYNQFHFIVRHCYKLGYFL